MRRGRGGGSADRRLALLRSVVAEHAEQDGDGADGAQSRHRVTKDDDREPDEQRPFQGVCHTAERREGVEDTVTVRPLHKFGQSQKSHRPYRSHTENEDHTDYMAYSTQSTESGRSIRALTLEIQHFFDRHILPLQ